jgi:hypothetical protein
MREAVLTATLVRRLQNHRLRANWLRVNSPNRSAGVIVDWNAFEIPGNWTVRSVRRFVPLKRYPCWRQAVQPEL